MWAVRWLFVILAFIIVMVITIYNASERTDFTLVPGYLEFKDITILLVVLISFLAGLCLAAFYSSVKFIRLKIDLTKKTKQIKSLQEELTAMRNLPLNEIEEGEEEEPLDQ